MELSALTALVVLVALTGGSFFCALAESALFSLGRWQLRRLQEEVAGARTARLARMLEQPEEVMSTLSLANTLANGMLVVTSLSLARQQGWNHWGVLGVAFVVVLFVGEILPKTLAVRSPEKWSIRVIPGVALLQQATRPLRRVARAALEWILGVCGAGRWRAQPVTDEEYRELLDMGVQQGALAHTEKEIIAELITLDRKCARDVMRPRATMAVVSDDLPLPQLVAEARRLRHRRLPLYDETPDTIVGVINVKQFLLDPAHSLDDSVELPSFVPETMNLWQLFQALQRQRRSVAIVLDEFGTVAGVVRMEDILAEVLGDMSGEGAGSGFVFDRLGPGRWRASGSMRLEDFRRQYPELPEVPEVETLAGLLLSQLDVVPAEGECATVHGLRLTAHRVDERRVHEVVVEVTGNRGHAA